MENEELMTRGHLAIALKVNPRTIGNWEKKGLPTYYIGKLPRYKYSEVLAFLNNRGRDAYILATAFDQLRKDIDLIEKHNTNPEAQMMNLHYKLDKNNVLIIKE